MGYWALQLREQGNGLLEQIQPCVSFPPYHSPAWTRTIRSLSLWLYAPSYTNGVSWHPLSKELR